MTPLSPRELDDLPCVVGIETAARALGISRTLAYKLAKEDRFPCRVIRIASTYRVPRADLERCLGVVHHDPPGDP
ncbi:DNA-binding protein [Actinomadura craniellae]|uniref:DNA-binding protein n=1 Tax=Actinomadura craniellae TaxID=2231787 RepID=A0A365GV40_9ACTN|nr:helix-turn-helix domain-containing protein [Actinomadura craniellae]RAY10652.1 DNA-binding protein [Actinomadura craniellae]